MQRQVDAVNQLLESAELDAATAKVVRRVKLRRFPAKVRIWHEVGQAVMRMEVNDRATGKTIEVETRYVATLDVWRDPPRAVAGIRRTLAKLLLHELDECLYYDGKLANDPHEARQGPVGA